MTTFNWHADYFDSAEGVRSVRSAVIKADNADDAGKIARGQMGLSKRVEVRRAATAAPVRAIYAHEGISTEILSSAEIRSLASAPRAPTVTLTSPKAAHRV
jgi:hypothetical protein